MTTTNYTKEIKYDRITKDFAVMVNGECIGYAGSYTDGESMANNHVYNLLTRTPNAVTEAEEVTEATPAAEAPAVAAAITRESVIDAADYFYEVSPEWSGAITKAINELNKGQWMFTRDVVVIRSASRNKRYRLMSGEDCQCEAGRRGLRCWHKAAAGLLLRAARVA